MLYFIFFTLMTIINILLLLFLMFFSRCLLALLAEWWLLMRVLAYVRANVHACVRVCVCVWGWVRVCVFREQILGEGFETSPDLSVSIEASLGPIRHAKSLSREPLDSLYSVCKPDCFSERLGNGNRQAAYERYTGNRQGC